MVRTTAIGWTDEMYVLGKKMFAEGSTSQEVADVLGVNIGALDSRIVRDRIAGKYWRPHAERPKDKQQPIKYTPDPRSNTGKLCGDPGPGRSALDKREAPKPKPSMGWW